MPPKAKGTLNGDKSSSRPKVSAAKGYKHAEPLPRGEILTDHFKRKWSVGRSIGVGGFGEIYSASDASKKNAEDFVIKIEPLGNGPLFVEMHFYSRAGKDETKSNWMASKKLKSLGIPNFYGHGIHVLKNVEYRFLVIQRLGVDIQKKLDSNGGVFTQSCVFTLGMKILDMLEYIHSTGYCHNDVKAPNLLLGPTDNNKEVYLVDYGLCSRYLTSDGSHKPHRKDPRCAHDGTLMYTSRDAHDGASFSRRGDMEILGFNMLHWLTGSLPWEKNKEPTVVMGQKHKFMQTLAQFGQKNVVPAELVQYFTHVAKLEFAEQPKYDQYKQLFKSALRNLGVADNGVLLFDKPKTTTAAAAGARKGRKPARQDESSEVEAKKPRKSPKTSLQKSSTNSKRTAAKKSTSEEATAPMFDNPTPAMRAIMAQLEMKKVPTKTTSKRATTPQKRVLTASHNGTTSRRRNIDISPDLF